MEKSKFQVLIVEDDTTQGLALQAAFIRAGFGVTLCAQTSQALIFAQHTEFHCLIVDCMLPGMNGIDLTRELLKLAHRRPKIFLISGIFKDKAFIKDAMDKTDADAFLPKPLDIPDMLAQLEALLSEATGTHAITTVARLYQRDVFDHSSMMRFLNEQNSLHAFHLPKLYQHIMETNLTGQLSVTAANGDVSEIGFFNGQIHAVKTPSRDSLFGAIAVNFGFVSAEDIAATSQDTSRKMIGQKLIDSMLLSPHALRVILEEQMALRLSQTLQNDVISVEWEMKNLANPDSVLSSTRFQQLCVDWLDSKFDPEWMRETLLGWSDHPLLGHLRASLSEAKNLREILQHDSFRNPQDLIAVFAGLLFGKLHLGVSGGPIEDFGFLSARLERLETNFQKQNYFQFLGISEKSHPRDLTRAFEGFKNSLSADALPTHCPPELAARAEKIMNLVQNAFNVLSNDIERPKYISMLNNRRSQEALEAEPIFRAAIQDILAGNYQLASLKLQSLANRKLEFHDLRAYRIWAGLRLDRNYNEIQFDQVPPEERHSPAFLTSRGVSYQIKGQFKKALECFRSAHLMDPDLNISRFETKALGFELDKNRGQNRELLREVVSALNAMPKGSRRQSA